MNSDQQVGFRLGVWRAYPLRNMLVGPPGEIHIEPKVMQVLEQLAANAGEVVERDHLLETLWGGRAMSDEPLTRCVATLRRVLDDSAKEPKFIQTIPKRGYRLVCDVETLARSSEPASSGNESSPVGRRGLAAIGIAFLLVVVAYTTWQQFADESPHLTVDGVVADGVTSNSVAVLPFANLGPDPDNEYLSDGLADELSNQLTQVPGVKVAARTSAFAFKDKNTDITDIARQLRVAYVLTGSVRQSEDRLRISAQLTEAGSGFHLWSETWDRSFTDIFDIQDEIAGAVIAALRVQLLNEVPSTRRTDPNAYDFYLRGQEAYFASLEPDHGETAPQMDQALSLLTHALAIDPQYAPAWAQVAWIHFQRAQWMRSDATQAFALAEAAARRAIDIDPDNTLALSALGAIYDLSHWDSVSAAEWFGKALTDAPDNAVLLNYLRNLLGKHEAYESSLPTAEAAYRNDPLNVQTLLNLALTYRNSGMQAAAREHLALARRMEPQAVRVQVFDALFAYLDGEYERAAVLAEVVNPVIQVCALFKLHGEDEVRDVLREMQNEKSLDALALARISACTGEHERAFELLQEAHDERVHMLRWMRTDYFLADLRDDPRWDELTEKIGVSDDLLVKMRALIGDAMSTKRDAATGIE
ncbi:MAG: winged helix-turn-helix domain-containing protein [Woeseia sp.]|nr:winged helix-turn-helix domain-containing protein [Woeseia sp.]